MIRISGSISVATRERQPQVHPAGVILQRQVGELAQAREFVDRLHLGQHLLAPEAEHGPVEQDVVEAGKLRVEARPHLDQRARRCREPRTVPVVAV